MDIRLDLGCGKRCKRNFEGVDISNLESVKYHIDLLKFPWPWCDCSVDEIWCSHFIEHIPTREVTESDIATSSNRLDMIGQDMFLAFFDECWRILKSQGKITLSWPALQTNRAFQDPTHRRFIPLETLKYLNADWRKDRRLDHYHAKCNFKKISYDNDQLPKSWTDRINYCVTLEALK